MKIRGLSQRPTSAESSKTRIHWSNAFQFIFPFLLTGSCYIAMASLELMILLPHLPSAGIMDMDHQTQLKCLLK